MASRWGRPPRNEFLQDLQALAFWLIVIGLVGYILFPNFFSDVYSRLTGLETTKMVNTESSGTYDPGSTTLGPYDYGILDNNDSYFYPNQSYTPSSIQSTMYNLGNEISMGYWVLFVAEGNFQQLSINSETYTFLLNLIEKDRVQEGPHTIILASNGQVKKFNVSDEIYSIITSMAAIDTRSKTT